MVENGFLMSNKNTIVVTGSSGRFGTALKNSTFKNNYKKHYPTKKQLNILNVNSIYNYLKKKKPKYVIHLAGLSRPMSDHDNNIEKSIYLNIVGTANMVVCCSRFNCSLPYNFGSRRPYQGGRMVFDPWCQRWYMPMGCTNGQTSWF